jgi:DNA-binding beta-propeller fold protein YncE
MKEDRMHKLAASLALAVLTLTGCSSGPHCSDTPGVACTWAGVIGEPGFNGNGLAAEASWLYNPIDLTFAPDGRAWIVDWNNHSLRRVEHDGTLRTVVGTDYEGDGPPGEVDRLPLGMPQGCPSTDVALNHPTDVEFLADGTAVIAAWHNNKIRVVDPTGRLIVLAGASYGFAGDGGPSYDAVMNQPKSVVMDEAGRIYTIDQRNERIRMIDVDAARTITTIAGACMVEKISNAEGVLQRCAVGAAYGAPNLQTTCPGATKTTICFDAIAACKEACTPGYSGEGGPALAARFGFDSGVTPWPSGALALRGRELYVADSLNNRIRMIDLDSGMVTCVAGPGCSIDYTFNYPVDLELGPDGRLYVADRYANQIEAVDLSARTVTVVAGNGQACAARKASCVESQVGVVLASEVQFHEPHGIAFDKLGNLYVADLLNSRIVRIAK